MNARSNSRFCKGSVLNTKHTTSSVAWVFEAARLFGFFTVRRTGKVGALAAQQRGSLLGLRFLRGNGTKSSLTDLLTRFGRTDVMSVNTSMAFAVMLLRGKAFKIFCSIVGFNSIDVVDMLVGIKRLQPAFSNYTMGKSSPSKHGVSIWSDSNCVWLELSENFSAARNCKKVVKESVFDSVYLDANHAVHLCG